MRKLFLLTLAVILSTACGSKQNKKQPHIVEGDSVPTQPETLQKVEGKEFLFDYNSEVLSGRITFCLLYTSPSPRDRTRSRMPSSA